MKRIKIKRKLIIIIIIAIIFLLISLDVRLTVTEYTISSDKINKPVKVALLTDLHSCNYGKQQHRLLDAIEKQNPDLVLFGGDIADDVLPIKNAIIVAQTLAKKYPCFYVTGNHEFLSGKVDEIKTKFQNCGLEVLEGECKTISINNQNINISGIDDPNIGIENFYIQLEKAKPIKNNNYSILLSHRPEYINKYLNYDYDLILSGHAHGGQWRIPFLMNGLYAPNQGFFPKYIGDNYKFDNTNFIVSRGLSRESTRIPRIFNRPELIIINLK